MNSSGRVVITGCSRGIGLEMVKQYAQAGWQVIATVRDPGKSEALQALAAANKAVGLWPLDVASDQSIGELSRQLEGKPVDLVINNAGIYGEPNQIGALDRRIWREVLEVNTISPLMVTQALLPNLLAGQGKTVAMISSKVGSIADNQSGGSYYYRSSKTALNQAVKSLSIDLASKGVRVLALHPGWVQTEMGGPNALIDTAQSVAGMRRVLSEPELFESGRFYAFDGAEIPW
ncbi:MAG: SDR family oxidoreductase [Pseudomonadales bacterium]|jgi:NAD(P)-dependent dehydrogenase (short-subunit alcohol dehydrogenase family)